MTHTTLSRRVRRRPQVEPLEGRLLLNAGDLDTSFGGTGSVLTQLTNPSGPQGLAVQADMKTVVVGIKNGYPGSFFVLRYNVDGSLDSTFGSGGEVFLATNSIQETGVLHNASVAIQPDGKIVVATNAVTISGGSRTSTDMLILRFNTNGSLDTSFGQNGETDIHLVQGMVDARGVAVLSSGQIVVAGSNPMGYVGPEFVVARLTSSGVLDTTFGPNGQGYNYTTINSATGNTDSVDAFGVDASGNLLVGGMYRTSSTTSVDRLVRYTPAGLIDTSFANQGIYDLPFNASRGFQGIGFQSNGQIILGYVVNPSTGTSGVTRLNPNGTLDTTFGSNGYFSDPKGNVSAGIAVQPNDEILFETCVNEPSGFSPNLLVDRLLPGGSLDPEFGTGGRVEPFPSNISFGPVGITVGPDGKIISASFYTAPGDGGVTFTFRLLGDAPTTGQLVVTTQPPASLAAGTPFGLTVEAEDSSGNIETSFIGTVTVALANNPGGATLGGTLTATASDGVATFSGLTLTTAASGYTLVAYSNGLSEAVTSAITVTPLAASQVGITQQPPSSVTAGSGFGLQAAIEDQYGNVIATATGTVTVALANNPGGATLGGTLTATASDGVATFSGLTLTKAATGYTLAVSSSGLSGSTSSAITVTPAAATQLVITQQPPASVVVNGAFGLVVAVEDTYGNVVTSASNNVKVALDNNPKGAKLGGTLTVAASSGVATFSGLTINKVGTGYTLQLTTSGLTSAVTNAINVTNSASGSVLSATTLAVAPDPVLGALVLDSPGFLDSLGLKKHARLI
jgi:uncharacterized delta-60 repeat protein